MKSNGLSFNHSSSICQLRVLGKLLNLFVHQSSSVRLDNIVPPSWVCCVNYLSQLYIQSRRHCTLYIASIKISVSCCCYVFQFPSTLSILNIFHSLYENNIFSLAFVAQLQTGSETCYFFLHFYNPTRVHGMIHR